MFGKVEFISVDRQKFIKLFTVSIFNSEQQARGLLKNDEGHRQQKCGEILNNKGPMDYHQHSGHLSITFRNMVSVL